LARHDSDGSAPEEAPSEVPTDAVLDALPARLPPLAEPLPLTTEPEGCAETLGEDEPDAEAG
jgi:hypothetical protein